jgi:localization factor PodJL
MSGQSPWSVKGVEPKTREAAKDLARREGLTLGELLNRLIADTEEPRSPAPQAPNYSPFSGQNSGQSSGQSTDRLTSALEQLTRRLEASGLGLNPSEPPSQEPAPSAATTRAAISSNDPTDWGAVSRQDPTDTLGHSDASLHDLRQTQAILVDKVRRLEATDPGHSSLTAMREMEAALASLSTQVTLTENRVGEIEKITEDALQTLDESLNLVTQRLATTETLAHETNNALVDGMVDLSARLTGLESKQDLSGEQGSSELGERLSQIESFSIQARENLDQDLTRIGERADRMEGFLRDHANSMVEALIELSARLTQVEGVGATGDLRLAIEALESKTSQIASQLADLDTNGGHAPTDVHDQVEAAISTTMERRFIDLAQALADRLDATEKRNHEIFDQINGRILHANDDLNQRVTQLETRSLAGDTSPNEAINARLDKLSQSMDERLSVIESQDVSGLAQTGNQLQILAETLSKRLDDNEGNAAQTVAHITQQMDNLADRLQANQEGNLQKLTERLDSHEARTQILLDEALGRVRLELQAAEDRTQAATMTLTSRLNTVEQATVAPYAEAILDKGTAFDAPSTAIAFDPDALNAIDDYSFETGPSSFGSTSYEDPFAAREPSATPSQTPPSRGRTGGFGSPVPTDDHGEIATDLEPFEVKSLSLDEPEGLGQSQRGFARSTDDTLEQGEELIGASLLDGFEGDTDSAFLDLDEDWNDLVAIDEIDTPADLSPNVAKPTSASPVSAKADAKSTRPAAANLKRKTAGKQKAKSGLSPVAMAAAAALVTAGGFAVYSQMNGAPERNHQPDVGNQNGADPVVKPVFSDAANQISSEPAQAAAPAAAPVRPIFDPPPIAARQAPEKAQFNPPEAPKQTKARFTQPPIERVRPASTTPSAKAAPVKATTKQAQSPAAAMSVAPNGSSTGPSTASVAPSVPAPSASPAASSRVLFEQALSREQAGDVAGSLALLNRAVDAGDVRAMNRLAKKYETGDGVAKDLGQARALTERAAARGSTEAMHNLGVYYAQGDGVPSNMVRAADYFRRAARRGIADSQFNLGAMAEQGLGGPKSDLQAYYWYGIASKSGDQDAATKAREVGQRLTTEQRAAQDKLIAQFRPEASPPD